MALNPLHSQAGFSTGEIPVTIINESGDITANSLIVSGNTDLGDLSNITIAGGTTGQFLSTDGSGVLTWATANGNGGGGNTITSQPVIEFTAASNGNSQSFTDNNLISFTSNLYSSVFKNGVLVPASEYTIVGNTLTITSYVQTTDAITVAPVTGPTPEPAGSNTEVQFNNNGSFGSSTAFRFYRSTNTMSVTGNVTSLNANLGNLATANFIAGTLTTAAQPNITSLGNLSGIRSSGLANFSGASNVALGPVSNIRITGGTNGQVLTTDGAGNLTWGAANATISGLSNGTSSVNIPAANANVTLTADGNTSLTVTNNGIEVTGVIIGNGIGLSALTGANVNGTVANATYAVSAGSATTATSATTAATANSVAGANVTGTVANATTATTAGTVTTAAQPNITSTGTLTGVIVSGNITGDNIVGRTGDVSITAAAGNNDINLVPTGTGTINAGNFRVTSVAEPTASTDAATKAYVDAAVASLHVHDSANAATTGTIASLSSGTTSYNNGANGVGARITTTGSLTAIDGVTLSANMRLLVKNEANAAWNGIYVYNNTTAITRSTDFDTSAEAAGGDFIFVTSGTINADTGWVQTTDNPTLGTSNIVFTQFSGAGQYTAGTGLTLTGSQFSISNTTVTAGTYGNAGQAVTFTVNGQGQLISASQNAITANANLLTGTTLNSGVVTSSLTSVGTLTGLTVNGTSNLGAVGNVRITGGIANYVLKTDGAGNLSWTAQSGGSGNGSSISNGNANLAIYDSNLQLKLGNISNVLYAEAYQFAANWFTSTVTANANISIASTTTGPNTYGGFLTVDKGITAQYITSNTSISAATIQGTIANTSNAQPNITSVGTLIALGVSGNLTVGSNITAANITASNAFYSGNYYGSGSQTFYGLNNVGMVVSNTGNANISTVLLRAGNSFDLGAPLIINRTTLSTSLNFSLTGANVSLGNVANVRINGGSNGQVITTDGAGNLSYVNLNIIQSSNSNVSIPSAGGNVVISAAGNANIVTVTGTGVNVTGTLNATGVITGIGSGLSSIAGGNVTGTVANATYATTAGSATTSATANSVAGANVTGTVANAAYSNIAATAYSVSGSNVTGTVANATYATSAGSALIAGTVTTVAQPNITSVGTLTALTVSGNASFTGANVSLGDVANLRITGGTANFVLQTDGTGNLSWAAQTGGGGSGTSIANGNSNVNIATANGNITMSVAGNANIVTVTGTGANVAGTANITGVANVGGNLNVAGNATFTGANVSLGDVANVHIAGGANGFVLSTDGSGNVAFIQSGYSVAQYLSVGRSSNQTIASGNWSSRDVIFNQVNQQLNIPYDTSTGLANLTANVTYRITAALSWQANTSYFYPFAIYDSNNTQVSQLFEAFPPSFGGNNSTPGVIDFMYTPTANTRIKTRTFTGITAGTGEWIRGAGPTGIATYMTIQAVAAPFVSTGATGMDYVQVKNSANLAVTANANIVFNTVTGNLGHTLYDTATGNFTLKANTTYRLLSSQAQLSNSSWFPFSWRWASNGEHVVSNINGLSSTTFPGAGTNEVIVTVGTSDANVQLRVDGNNSGTIRANSGWAIAQAIGGQATTTNLNLLGNLTIGGTTWQPGVWTANTAWTLGAVTTAPTFATTNNRRLTWKVEGKTMYINGFYRQTSATGAAAGSGEYLLTLPGSFQVDTTVTGTAASGTAFGLPVGTMNFSKTGTVGVDGSAIVYDATRVKFIFAAQSSGTTTSTLSTWGSAYHDLTSGAAMDVSFVLQIPIL